MNETYYYYWLAQLWQIPTGKLWRCAEVCGGVTALYQADAGGLEGILTKRECAYLRRSREDRSLPERWNRQAGEAYRFVPYDAPDYPERLRLLPDAPFGIWYAGRLPAPEEKERAMVAVVGSRTATAYGRELAYRIAGALSARGVGIVSGLAAGVDGAGHRGCLDAGGYTLGVLGSGIRSVYPREHAELYRQLRERGGILTEYPPEQPPLPALFPRRNRLISILSDFVLVVEARAKSGSLITADCALEQGRDVGAVPGRPCDAVSAGCNRLIQQGAKCVLSAEDILEELPVRRPTPVAEGGGSAETGRAQPAGTEPVNTDLGLAPQEKKVYSCLRLEPEFIDDILRRLPYPAWEGIQILTELEVRGLVRQEPQQYYYKVRA